MTALQYVVSLLINQKLTTMNDLKIYKWHTGDWKTHTNADPPYNGVEIIATAHYNAHREFIYLDLEITDYSLEKEGVSSLMTLRRADLWINIPVPKTSAAYSIPNPHFTIDGQVKLINNNDIFLQVDFVYGIPQKRRKELGYIMKIDKTIPKKTQNYI